MACTIVRANLHDRLRVLTEEKLRTELAYWQCRIGVREAAIKNIRAIKQELEARGTAHVQIR